MSVQLHTSLVIDRPVDKVFRFYALGHVRSHPRWDPDIKLEQISEGPLGVGTLIRRHNTRSGTLVEGSMEGEHHASLHRRFYTSAIRMSSKGVKTYGIS